MSSQSKVVYKFGPFQLDKFERRLSRNSETIPLTPKAFETLLIFVESGCHLLTKDELMARIWPDTFVEEATLAQNVFTLRRVLGERPDGQQFIETVPKRGYRFVHAVTEFVEPSLERAPQPEAEVALVAPAAIDDSSKVVSDAPRLAQPEIRKSRINWPLRVASTIICIGLIYMAFQLLKTPRVSESDRSKRTLAVLPFQTLNSELESEYLGLGMTDALITKLSNVKSIVVRPTSAVLKYNSAQMEPAAAGRDLRVALVLEGRVQKAGDHFRLTVQLVSVENGAPLWADKFDAQFVDIIAVQDSISEQVVSALTLKLSTEERAQLNKRYTTNPDAYQDYLKGRFYWSKWTEEGFSKSAQYFRQAIEKDSEFSLPYIGLADSFNVAAFYGYVSPMEVMPQAKLLAHKALEIDDTLAEAHTTMANALLFYDWNWDGAEQEFKRALDLNPSDVGVNQSYGVYLLARGRFSAAKEALLRAQELDPVSLITTTVAGFPYYFSGDYDRALDFYDKVIEMDPSFGLVYAARGDVLEAKGLFREALAEHEKSLKLLGRKPGGLSSLGHTYALLGDKANALRIIDELTKLSKRQYVSPIAIATVYSGLAEKDPSFKDKAFDWLQAALEERSNRLVFLKTQPTFRSLRGDPRFVVLLKRIGLGE